MSNVVRILGLDTSSVNLGYCVAELNLTTKVMTVMAIDTFTIKKDINRKVDMSMVSRNERTILIDKVRNYTIELISAFNINFVVAEDPIYASNPDTLKNQVDALSAIRHGVNYCFNNPIFNLLTDIEIISPMVVKQIAGAGNTGDKQLITDAIYRLIDSGVINYLRTEDLPNNVDEHGNDAVLIAYHKVLNLPI